MVVTISGKNFQHLLSLKCLNLNGEASRENLYEYLYVSMHNLQNMVQIPTTLILSDTIPPTVSNHHRTRDS